MIRLSSLLGFSMSIRLLLRPLCCNTTKIHLLQDICLVSSVSVGLLEFVVLAAFHNFIDSPDISSLWVLTVIVFPLINFGVNVNLFSAACGLDCTWLSVDSCRGCICTAVVLLSLIIELVTKRVHVVEFKGPGTMSLSRNSLSIVSLGLLQLLLHPVANSVSF